MNISNIILSLQEKISSSGSLDLMTYGKIIEKLKVGTVRVVNTFSDLPVVSDDGNLFLVKSEDELYFNVGSTFKSLAKFLQGNSYAWGSNSAGQLGDNTTTSKSSPVTAVGSLNWAQVSAGRYHSHGITTDGIAYAWGNNTYGRLGAQLNVNTSTSSPVTLSGGITNWAQVSAGDRHSLGLTSTGIAYAWGNNTYGRLGDNTTTSRLSPVTVVGGITNWKQVSAGGGHSLGVTSTGIAYAWGRNGTYQLGNGQFSDRASPVTVLGGITNWAQVDASSSVNGFSVGITSTGIAYAWGFNNRGQLGDNSTSTRSSPVTVVGGITNWAQVSAGYEHVVAITSTGIAYAWGYTTSGRLGNNDTSSNRSSPVTVVGGITNWAQVSAGREHSLGVTSTGIAYAWGRNTYGRLGDNSTTSQLSPVTVVGGITNWTQVDGGDRHSIAISSSIKSFTQ
jgi:alpha-tubulin suppressor-like RCC1 family protein